MRKVLPAQRSAALNQALENGQALVQAGCFVTENSTSAKRGQWLNTVIIRAEVPSQLFLTPVIFTMRLSVFCINLKRVHV